MFKIESNVVFSFEFRNKISMQDVDNTSLDEKPTNNYQSFNDTSDIFYIKNET